MAKNRKDFTSLHEYGAGASFGICNQMRARRDEIRSLTLNYFKAMFLPTQQIQHRTFSTQIFLCFFPLFFIQLATA